MQYGQVFKMKIQIPPGTKSDLIRFEDETVLFLCYYFIFDVFLILYIFSFLNIIVNFNLLVVIPRTN